MRTLKFVQKVRRMCYIKITEILQYDQAEQLCQDHGVQLAIIDNIPLLEQLKEMHMCKILLTFQVQIIFLE